jgi:ADP-heptose:LPS heptosyltransferase
VFKPDGIGDFVLVTGCLRTIAREIGEENLLLCVRTPLVALAQSQFPRATIVDLPVAGKRRVVNLFVANLARTLPVIRQLRRTPVDVALCFRHMRSYLQTLVFYSANARRFLASENLLARSRRLPRVVVERLAALARQPEILPYPEPTENLPSELAANAALTARLLGRALAE